MNRKEAPIRICRVIARMNVGGPAVHITQLSAGLDSQRFKQLLVAGTEAPGEASMLTLARGRGVDPIIVPELGRELDPKGDLVALLKLYRLFRAWRPDIVETHTAKAGTLGRVAALLAGVPVRVHVFHGHVLRGYFGPLKTRVFVEIERALSGITTRTVALGEAQRRDILGFGIGTPETVVSVPLGLDLAPFAAAGRKTGTLRAELRPEGVSQSSALFGIVGRLAPIKRHDVFLKAARLVLDELPDAHFVIVGDGERRAALEAQARDLGIAQRMHFLGWQDNATLPAVYADLDVVVNTSDNEGMPVSLIEAMAAGLPVVATDVGGTSSVVEQDRTGHLVAAGDAPAVAASCLRLARDPELRARMGSAARGAVNPAFDVSTLLETMSGFYTSLVRGQPKAGRRVM